MHMHSVGATGDTDYSVTGWSAPLSFLLKNPFLGKVEVQVESWTEQKMGFIGNFNEAA